MSLAEMQACLARLYVNEPLRQLFRIDPSVALKGYDLTPEEAGALRQLDCGQLDRFAGSLVSKRRKSVERAYPLLFALDGAAMRRYYWRFFQLYPAKPRQGRHQDAVDFGEFMEESLAGAEQLPAYAGDLARYERLYYLAMTAATAPADVDGSPPTQTTVEPPKLAARPALARDVQVADFAYDVARIEEALQKEHIPDAAAVADNCTIVFMPRTSRSEARMLKINEPTKLVVARCDGHRTVAQIVAETETALGANDLGERIVESLDRLVVAGVLVLDGNLPQQPTGASRFGGGAFQTESM
jgi:hypothetical protein